METQSILFILALLVACFLTCLAFAHESLDGRIRQRYAQTEGTLPEHPDEVEKIWKHQSLIGQDPFLVVTLGYIIAQKYRLGYLQPLHVATSYYSQVKHLLKKGRLPTAIVFFLHARRHLLHALLQRSGGNALVETRRTYKKAIELEMIGAPSFLLAAIPLVGIFFRTGALLYLLTADEEISYAMKTAEEAKESGSDNVVQPNSRIEKAIIWGKLYKLTKDAKYRERVLAIPFRTDDREENSGQYECIAGLIGLKSAEELFASLGSTGNQNPQAEEDAKFAKELSDALKRGEVPDPPQKQVQEEAQKENRTPSVLTEETLEQGGAPASEPSKPGLTPIPCSRRVDPTQKGVPRRILGGSVPIFSENGATSEPEVPIAETDPSKKLHASRDGPDKQ